MGVNWNQLVGEIGPGLYRYFAVSFRAERAAELVQETLLRLVSKFEDGEFDPAKGSPRMFAYGIARNVRLEAWKAVPPEDTYGDPSEYDHRVAPEADPVEAELRRLRAAIGELDEIQRQVILLHIDQELTLAEIAAVVGVPVNTIKSHVHRAKAALRKKEGILHA